MLFYQVRQTYFGAEHNNFVYFVDELLLQYGSFDSCHCLEMYSRNSRNSTDVALCGHEGIVKKIRQTIFSGEFNFRRLYAEMVNWCIFNEGYVLYLNTFDEMSQSWAFINNMYSSSR